MRDIRAWLIGRTARTAVVGAVVLTGVGATKGPDGGGYTATDSAVYSLVDAAGAAGGVSVLSGIDDGLAALTIPFPFRFYGQVYTVTCVSSNGALYFVNAASACSGFSDFGNVDLTTTATPNDLPAALPFWTDLTFQVPGAGSVFYQTVGAPGSRRFVVQWHNAYPQGSPNPVTFQAVLSEGSHQLLFQYQTVTLGDANVATNGRQATIGIRNAGAPASDQQIAWSFEAPVLADSTALQFSKAFAKVTGDVDGDGVVNCTDIGIVKAAYGKRAGQAGFDARADVNGDKIVNLTDLATVTRALPAGTRC